MAHLPRVSSAKIALVCRSDSDQYFPAVGDHRRRLVPTEEFLSDFIDRNIRIAADKFRPFFP